MQPHRILFVDDDGNVLNSLRRLFIDEDHDIHTACSAEEALEQIKNITFALIVSDHAMPGMQGVDLLKRIKEVSPTMIGILLTGTADMSTTIEAINSGSVYRYVAKPWDDRELRLIVREALHKFDVEEKNRELEEEIRKQNARLAELNRTLEEANEKLRISGKRLEETVQERTAELRNTNKQLRAEIADRMRAERALRESRERLADAQRMACLGHWEWDVQTRRLVWSDDAHRVFGLQSPDFAATYDELLELVHPDDRVLFRESIEEAVRKPGAFVLDYRIALPNGEVRHINIQGKPASANEENAIRLVGTVQDITERKRLEEQLAQSHRLEGVGQLASGVAHDFNNLLTAILGNADIALRTTQEDSDLHEILEEIQSAGNRAANLTRQLLAFSRKRTFQPQVIDINETLSGLLKMLGRLAREDIKIESRFAEGLWRTRADPGHVEQVIINLTVNAGDAMPAGGQITIETANTELDEQDVSECPGLQPGRYVTLTVIDTGTGMSEEVRRRIFEPFFTTKPEGKGTGLGLAIVHRIVKQHGGDILVRTETGKGTTFTICLPAVQEADNLKDGAESLSPQHGTETILLVEDEEGTRTVIARVLSELGYTVLQAEGALKALTILDECAKGPDLLLTDVIMPDMNGLRLAEEYARRYPDGKTLFISGYAADTPLHDGPLDAHIEFLQKPFSAATLAQKVRHVLD